MTDTIVYSSSLDGVTPGSLEGFFTGWPTPPAPERHLDLLRGSSHRVLALDGERVVGFVTAISDGVLTAFIPLLEVLPSHRSRGIGSELVRRILDELGDLYAVDIVCDDDVVPFYERLGLRRGTAMLRRRYERQSAESSW